ncbi:MAG TPA: hypothetical protein VM434_10115 [Beijerinckiaceae bacterium]|nr:hypothetical protein [Beijerinckiaceae bacterium]
MRNLLRNLVGGLRRRLPGWFRDAVGLAGAGSVSYGAHLLHPAAGYITGGVLAMVFAFALGIVAARQDDAE